MRSETIMAACMVASMLMTFAMWVFAWKLNKDWAEFVEKMNDEWAEFYQKVAKQEADDE